MQTWERKKDADNKKASELSAHQHQPADKGRDGVRKGRMKFKCKRQMSNF